MSLTGLISYARNFLTSKMFLMTFTFLLVISISIAYVASEARPQERFLSMSTLDSNMMAENYYPMNDSTISIGDNVNWYLSIYNRMGNAEYLSVRIKLLNSTQTVPDDNLHLPSPENQIIEMKHMLMDSSTWLSSLDWTVKKVDREREYTVIKSLEINGTVVDNLNVRSSDGTFRIIIELWRYDTETKDFSFAWSSGLDNRSVWNQIWFSIKQSI